MNTRHDQFSARVSAEMADFDKDWETMRQANAKAVRWLIVWWIFCLMVVLVFLAFIAWVIVVLLRFTGAV